MGLRRRAKATNHVACDDANNCMGNRMAKNRKAKKGKGKKSKVKRIKAKKAKLKRGQTTKKNKPERHPNPDAETPEPTVTDVPPVPTGFGPNTASV